MPVTVLPKMLDTHSQLGLQSAIEELDSPWNPLDEWHAFEACCHELVHARLLGIRIFGDLEHRTYQRISDLLSPFGNTRASTLNGMTWEKCWQNEAQTVEASARLYTWAGGPLASKYRTAAVAFALYGDHSPGVARFRKMMRMYPEQTAEAVEFVKGWLVRHKFVKIEGSK